MPKIAVISAAHPGYRRAGIELAQGKNELDAEELTKAQLAALKADPRLTVMELADEAPAKGKGKNADAPQGKDAAAPQGEGQ